MKSHAPAAVGQGRAQDQTAPAVAPLAFGAGQAAYGNAFAQTLAVGQGMGVGESDGSSLLGGAFGEGEGQDARPPVPEGGQTEDPLEPGEGYGVAWGEDGCSQDADRLHEQGDDTEAEGPAESQGTLEIHVANHNPDAGSRSQFNRTTVGVGEAVNFDCFDTGGTWSASSGTGSADADGFYSWQAPGAPGSATITYTKGDETGSIVMTVVAPTSITSEKTGALPAAHAGVGMSLQLTIHPLTVSFYNVDWFEVPGGGTGDGYFERFPASALAHGTAQGAGSWIPMGADNKNVTDRAGLTGWGEPWSPGVWTWVIPTHYRAQGGASTLFHTETQVMAITDSAGSATVSKYGQSA